MATPKIRVWSVRVDERTWTFQDLETALTYLRAELANNGALSASIESSLRTSAQYRRAVEKEDSPGYGRAAIEGAGEQPN